MKCDQCGKEITKTNCNSIIINGVSVKLCGKHYAQYIKFGHFLDSNPRSVKDINEFDIKDDCIYVYTFNKKSEISGRFIIDKDDLDRVIKRKWRFWKNEYFTGVKKPIQISRFIMGVDDENLVVDHINGDRTDNRKSNLRITSQQMNLCNKAILSNNKSEFAGVWYDKNRNKWSAEIRLNGIKCLLGRYVNKKDAVYARYYAELRLFGEFRSTRNDKNIFEYIEKCDKSVKIGIEKYIDTRLNIKYDI